MAAEFTFEIGGGQAIAEEGDVLFELRVLPENIVAGWQSAMRKELMQSE